MRPLEERQAPTGYSTRLKPTKTSSLTWSPAQPTQSSEGPDQSDSTRCNVGSTATGLDGFSSLASSSAFFLFNQPHASLRSTNAVAATFTEQRRFPRLKKAHFAWAPVSRPQPVCQPFSIALLLSRPLRLLGRTACRGCCGCAVCNLASPSQPLRRCRRARSASKPQTASPAIPCSSLLPARRDLVLPSPRSFPASGTKRKGKKKPWSSLSARHPGRPRSFPTASYTYAPVVKLIAREDSRRSISYVLVSCCLALPTPVFLEALPLLSFSLHAHPPLLGLGLPFGAPSSPNLHELYRTRPSISS